MITVKTNNSHVQNYLIITFCSFAACTLLFCLDKDILTVRDMLQNFMGLLIYVVPTFLVSFLLYKRLIIKNNKTESIQMALALGLPSGTMFVMITLKFLMYLSS
jgi:hypothetical protein